MVKTLWMRRQRKVQVKSTYLHKLTNLLSQSKQISKRFKPYIMDHSQYADIKSEYKENDLYRFRAMHKEFKKGKGKHAVILKATAFNPQLTRQLNDRAVPPLGQLQTKKYSSVSNLFACLRQRQILDTNCEDGLSEYERCDKMQRKLYSQDAKQVLPMGQSEWSMTGDVFQEFDVNADCFIEDIIPGKAGKIQINIGQPKGEGEEPGFNLPPEQNPNVFRMNTVPDIINNVSSVDGIITKDHVGKTLAKMDGKTDSDINPFNTNDERVEDLEIQNDPIAPVGLVNDIQMQERKKVSIEEMCSKKTIVWRDKLKVDFTMDSVTLLDTMAKFFKEVGSFERDPDNGQIMHKEEQFTVRLLVDRALNWLITQIAFENIEPIKLTLLSSGEHKDVIDALSDERNIVDVKDLIRMAKSVKPNDEVNQIYLTPHFLQQFDFKGIDDRLYLRAKLKFCSGLLGFQGRIYHNRFRDSLHYVSVRCMVGSMAWHRRKESLKKPYTKFKRCPFFLQYVRPYCEHTGVKGKFELHKFDFTHSHPLSLEYEKADIIAEAEAYCVRNPEAEFGNEESKAFDMDKADYQANPGSRPYTQRRNKPIVMSLD